MDLPEAEILLMQIMMVSLKYLLFKTHRWVADFFTDLDTAVSFLLTF